MLPMFSITLLYDKSFAFDFFIRFGFYSQYWFTIPNLSCLLEYHSLFSGSLFGFWFFFWFILLLFCLFIFLLIRLETLHPIFVVFMYAFFSDEPKYKRPLEVDFFFIFYDMNISFLVLSRKALAIHPSVTFISLFFVLTLICEI